MNGFPNEVKVEMPADLDEGSSESSESDEEDDELSQNENVFAPIQNNHVDPPRPGVVTVGPEESSAEDESDFDLDNLPDTIRVLTTKAHQTIYLIGTSHFSKQSHREVRRLIRTVRPQVVMLELCNSRRCFLEMDEEQIREAAKNLDFGKILDYMKRNGVLLGFIYGLLLTASAKVTKDLDLAPGGEFRNAFREALKIPGCRVILGDRPIDITLRRTLASLSVWQRVKMTYHCLFSSEVLNEEELEKYKERDTLEKLVEELSVEFPGLSRVMVDERDSYLAHSLWSICQTVGPNADIVGVVGIGHSAGIETKWPNVEQLDIQELVSIPIRKPSITLRVMKYSIYAGLAYTTYRYLVPKSLKTLCGGLARSAVVKLGF